MVLDRDGIGHRRREVGSVDAQAAPVATSGDRRTGVEATDPYDRTPDASDAESRDSEICAGPGSADIEVTFAVPAQRQPSRPWPNAHSAKCATSRS